MKEKSMRLAVFVSGRGSNMSCILSAISQGELDMHPILVLSDRAGAPALDRAREFAVSTEVVQFDQDRENFGSNLLNCIQEYNIEVIALAGFMRILPPNFFSGFDGDVLNIHPALLPAFPGLDAQQQALDYGVKVSGCTVHFVDEGVDTGPIILQATVPVYDDDDEESLSDRILKWEHRLYPRALQKYAEGKLKRYGRKVVRVDE